MTERSVVRWEPVADTTDWRLIVESRARRLRTDLAMLDGIPAGARERASAEESLAIVEETVHQRDRWWRAPAAWWSGWRVERSWRALHDAEVAAIAGDPHLAGRLPGIRARVRGCLEHHDERRVALETRQLGEPPTATDRAIVVDAVRAAFDASDEVHAAARALRNKLVVAALLLAVLDLSLGLLGAFRPTLLPMCAPRTDLAAGQPAQLICAAGGSTPASVEVWLVLLLGAVGAAVASVVLLIRRRPSLSPYVLVGYQAAIKMLLGGILAVIGVLALGAGVGEGIACLHTQSAVLLWALALGYAQQLGTRLLDNYADRVLNRIRPLPPDV